MAKSLQDEICIIIPVYKTQPDVFEIKSFEQCARILNKYKICFVAPESLNITSYKNVVKNTSFKIQMKIERFDNDFFASVKGYNRLMLSVHFYKRFANYKYILIYQLDSWIFRDDLLHWCKKGYDYIGAPWINNYWSDFYARHLTLTRTIASKLGYKDFHLVGNGGLSLRKTSSFLFNLKLFNNRASKFLYNEDYFFSFFINSYNPFFKVAKFDEALKFAFDEHPETAFKLNNDQLPMGCHAWNKSKCFWKHFIPFSNELT